jgi:hypothetical protein
MWESLGTKSSTRLELTLENIAPICTACPGAGMRFPRNRIRVMYVFPASPVSGNQYSPVRKT